MGQVSLGNVYYFDTAGGAVNNGSPTKISKIALWGTDGASLLFTVSGYPVVRLSVAINGTSQDSNWQEVNFGEGIYFSNASITSVAAGSGYVFIV